MLDGFPLGGSGRVVRDGDVHAEGIRYLSLELDFPAPASATVAAAAVGQDQEFGGALTARPFPFPPSGDGMRGEGRRVVRDADTDGAAVASWRPRQSPRTGLARSAVSWSIRKVIRLPAQPSELSMPLWAQCLEPRPRLSDHGFRRFVSALLVGVTTLDPVIYAGCTIALLVVALAGVSVE
jgi:hypothetical protein